MADSLSDEMGENYESASSDHFPELLADIESNQSESELPSPDDDGEAIKSHPEVRTKICLFRVGLRPTLFLSAKLLSSAC
jgi:hypothetical protein